MFEIARLQNGVRLALESIPSARSVAFGLFVLNGSRNENKSNNGISHFIEHMLFKGTQKRTALEIADEMDAIGGQLNAYTTKEYTCYFARTLDTHFNLALDVLSDMFFKSTFDPEEIEKEKKVVLEEISMHEDTPDDLAMDMMQSCVWKDNPLSHSILGAKKCLKSFQSEGLREYVRLNYRPENTVVAVAGNFNEKEIIGKLEEYFGSFPQAPPYEEKKWDVAYQPGVTLKSKKVEQLHLCAAFPGVAAGSSESYAVAALNTLFGGGMSSRLFQTVREKHGLVYSVFSYNSSYLDGGLFNIYAGLNPAAAGEYIRLVKWEIDRLFSQRFSELDLYKTKEQLKSNYIMSLESTSSRMSSIGRSTLLLNRMLTPDDLIQKIEEISLESLYAVAEKIFPKGKMSLSAVGKVKGIDWEGFLND